MKEKHRGEGRSHMQRSGSNIQARASFLNRFLLPLLIASVVMASSRIVFNNAVRIESPDLYSLVAVLSGTLQFASVVLVAMLLYPITYFRGATAVERVTAASMNLALWIGIDTYHVSEAFPLSESLYYGIQIGAILFAWNFALMGMLELACRAVSKRRGNPIRIVTPLPILPILLFLAVICLLSKQGGAYYFNLLLDGYLALFR